MALRSALEIVSQADEAVRGGWFGRRVLRLGVVHRDFQQDIPNRDNVARVGLYFQ